MKILVAYSSKQGSTAQIASLIASELNKMSFTSDLKDVSEPMNLSDYDAFIIGSPIHAGNWLGSMRKWVAKHKVTLIKKPVALFSVGMAPETGTAQIAKTTAKYREMLSPIAIGYFPGRMDLEKLGFVFRAICKLMKSQTKDLVDPAKVAQWTAETAKKLG